MNNNYPLVSVIIPTYKRSHRLGKCIDSVLNQTYKRIEIIVIDDNGRDTFAQKQTESALKEYIDNDKVTYIIHEINKNGSAARNTGLRISEGEYVLFLDDDDFLLPEMIEVQLNNLRYSGDDVGAIYCNSIVLRKQRFNRVRRIVTNYTLEGNICKERLTGVCSFNTSTILFKRRALEELNGFDDSFVRHQDFEILVRFFCKYKIIVTESPLVLFDTTSEDLTNFDVEKEYKTKCHFFDVLEMDLKTLGFFHEVAHHLWLQCALHAIKERNKKVFTDCIRLCRENGRLSFKDYSRLLKWAIWSI